jgi:CTP:molybdopterin cytidylyltransferase MocA
MGRPKALVELDGEPLVRRALRALAGGGCGPLFVVTGAAADEVAEVVAGAGAPVTVVHAPDWAEDMGASLWAGLDAVAAASAVAASAPDAQLADTKRGTRRHEARDSPVSVLLHLVDLPGVGAPAIARLAALASAPGGGPEVLARASYDGVPGHPVLLGRAHWPGVHAAATGDAGARGYLAGHPELRLVDCTDVADPRDVDTPDALRSFGGAEQ